MIRAIKELIQLKGRKRLSREDRAHARENIKKLYTSGFTSGEISYFANWLSVDTIRKYCRGLEVKDTEMKKHVLELLGEFALINGDWNDLEYYVKSKKNVIGQDLTLDDILDLKKDIDRYHIDLEDFGYLSAKLDEENKDWEWFIDKNSMINQLLEQGYTVENLTILKEKTAKMRARVTF